MSFFENADLTDGFKTCRQGFEELAIRAVDLCSQLFQFLLHTFSAPIRLKTRRISLAFSISFRVSSNRPSTMLFLNLCKCSLYTESPSITWPRFCSKIGVHISGEFFASRTVDSNPPLARSKIALAFFSLS